MSAPDPLGEECPICAGHCRRDGLTDQGWQAYRCDECGARWAFLHDRTRDHVFIENDPRS